MSNVAIYEKGSNEISSFIIDAIVINNGSTDDFIGQSGKFAGVKRACFDCLWTDDIANRIFDEDGILIGYDKTVSELAEDGENSSVVIPDAAEYRRAVKIMEVVSSKTDDQIRTYVNNRITDLPSAKKYLCDLSIVVAALYKIVNREIHK